jgi:hypothetical protein
LNIAGVSADLSGVMSSVHTVASDSHLWLGFFCASIAIALSPGAGALQSMAAGMTHGLWRAYWSIIGQELGLLFQLTLVAVGLGAVVAKSILAFTIIKFVGVGYLLYLAVRHWRGDFWSTRPIPTRWCSISPCCRSSCRRSRRCRRGATA